MCVGAFANALSALIPAGAASPSPDIVPRGRV